MRVKLFFIIASIIFQLITSLKVYFPTITKLAYVKYNTADPQRSKSINVVPPSSNVFERQYLCKVAVEVVQHHMEYDLYFNAEEFTNHAPENVVKTMKFDRYPYKSFVVVYQFMYQCYGRHKIIRSSVYLDDYYDLYYVSYGPTSSSMVIYRHEKAVDPADDWFRPMWLVDELPATPDNTLTTGSEVDDATSKQKTRVSYNMNEKEVEFIYLREVICQGKRPKEDELARLDANKLTEFCIDLLDPNQLFQLFQLDTSTSTVLMPPFINKIIFKHHMEYSEYNFRQPMFPCIRFGQEAQYKDYWHTLESFQLSGGPRPASVIIYKRDQFGYFLGYRPVYMVENLPDLARYKIEVGNFEYKHVPMVEDFPMSQ